MEENQNFRPLRIILDKAYERAASGKGWERHGKYFGDWDNQPIMMIQRMVGSGYSIGQILKKGQEAATLQHNDPDQAVKELQDVIVYAAAAIRHIGSENDS